MKNGGSFHSYVSLPEGILNPSTLDGRERSHSARPQLPNESSISPIQSDSAVILSRYLQIEFAMKATLLIVGLPRLKNWVTVSC